MHSSINVEATFALVKVTFMVRLSFLWIQIKTVKLRIGLDNIICLCSRKTSSTINIFTQVWSMSWIDEKSGVISGVEDLPN